MELPATLWPFLSDCGEPHGLSVLRGWRSWPGLLTGDDDDVCWYAVSRQYPVKKTGLSDETYKS